MKSKASLQVIDTPVYSYWRALYLSCFSQRLYVDVAKRWRGFGIVYLLFVIAVAIIPLSVRIMVHFNSYFNENMLTPLQHMPALYVQNGVISFDKPMPYLIKNKKGEVVLIIDTTGQVQGMEAAYPQLAMLVTKREIMFRVPPLKLFHNAQALEGADKVYVHKLSKNDNEVFSGNSWVAASGVTKLKWSMLLLVYPLLILCFFSMYFIFMLALSLLGQVIAGVFFALKITFKQSARLLTVASTLPNLLFLFIFALDSPVIGVGLLYSTLLMLYFCYALLSLKRISKQLVHL